MPTEVRLCPSIWNNNQPSWSNVSFVITTIGIGIVHKESTINHRDQMHLLSSQPLALALFTNNQQSTIVIKCIFCHHNHCHCLQTMLTWRKPATTPFIQFLRKADTCLLWSGWSWWHLNSVAKWCHVITMQKIIEERIDLFSHQATPSFLGVAHLVICCC